MPLLLLEWFVLLSRSEQELHVIVQLLEAIMLVNPGYRAFLHRFPSIPFDFENIRFRLSKHLDCDVYVAIISFLKKSEV